MHVPKMQVIKVSRPLRKSAFIVGDSMIKKSGGYLLISSIKYKYIVKDLLSLQRLTICTIT